MATGFNPFDSDTNGSVEPCPDSTDARQFGQAEPKFQVDNSKKSQFLRDQRRPIFPASNPMTKKISATPSPYATGM
jgi:hypothetical protein